MSGSAMRIYALVMRHIQIWRSSVMRLVDSIYWPAVQMVMWGFMTQYLLPQASFVAQAAGVLLSGLLLWEVVVRDGGLTVTETGAESDAAAATIRAAAAPMDDAIEAGRKRLRLFQLLAQAHVAERKADLGLLDHVTQFFGAQERHGGDHHPAGLHHREIGGDHHRAVRPAQQHAIARRKAELARQRIGDAVHALREFGVCVALVWRAQARPRALAPRDRSVQQFDRGIKTIGIIQIGKREDEVGPLLARRQVIPRERIRMRRRNHR